jgi:TolB-like protein/class 3 adenylate cyclase/cytochrome c-type biogenesis protein CcmH/NrfG
MKKDPSSAVPSETRRLAAIMFTDIVGFSRQMGANEARTLRLLETHDQIIQKAVAEHHGTVIKTVGDAFLVDFPSVVHAVQCAQQIQHQFRTYNAAQAKDEQIHVRIGIHLGDIVQKDGDVFGDGVNIASRLQGLAEPDSICISDVVYRDVAKKLDLGAVVSLGQPKLKNIDQRLPVYMLVPEHADGVRQTLRTRGFPLIRRLGVVPWMGASLLLIAGAIIAARYLFLPPSGIQSPASSTQAAPAALPLPDKPSIAVLPFVNISEDPKQEYFSDGITEDLITDLSKLSGLFVIARHSAFTYKGKAVKVQDVSRELGVRYVLEGSVRKAGDRMRITAQLVEATTGHHLWSERYDRPLQDIFALQEEIRRKIVTHLALRLTEGEQARAWRQYTSSPEAYDSLLRGEEYFHRFAKEANTQARQLFEKALELDPTYAVAYVWLGWTHFVEWLFQWNPDPQNLEQAFTLAQKALALDDSLASAHLLLGQIYPRRQQHDQAIAEGERALLLAPNCADCYQGMAEILGLAGRPAEAIGLMEQAMRLNPQYPAWYLLTLGRVYHSAERYEEAVEVLKNALTHNPNNLGAHIHLAAAYSELGREEEARAEAAEILRLSPNFSLEVVRWEAQKDPVIRERLLAAMRKAGLK